MKKKLIALVGVIALGASMATAGEGKRHVRGEGRPGARVDILMEKLDLSVAQRAQIEQIRKSSRDNHPALMEEFRLLHEEMRAARAANDTARVETLRARFQAKSPQMKQIHEAEMAQIMTVLNDDQKAKFKALKAEAAAKGRRGDGKH